MTTRNELITAARRAVYGGRLGYAAYEEFGGSQTDYMTDLGSIIDAVRPLIEADVLAGSVLQPWVMKLPLRMQGTLLTGIRGCDLQPKLPLDATARQLVGYLRSLVMNPADPREVGLPGAFFQSDPPEDWKPSELGHLPQHWYSHLMHCYEVCAYRHPDEALADVATDFYYRLAESLHLQPETSEMFQLRMIEDRIANGTVVS